MSKLAIFLLGLCLMLGGAGASFAQNAVTADTVVATVNGTEITLGHLIQAREVLPAQYRDLPPEVLFDGLRDQLVQQTVLVQSMAHRSKRLEIVLQNEERALIAGEALNQVATIAVTDAALQAAYDARFANVSAGQEFNASHILVEDEAEALRLIGLIEDGEEFADLAREHSTGPSGPNGGQLGWFGPGAMVKPFEDAVMELEVGAVSVPVQTQFGFHVIRLNEVRAQPVPALDEVRAELVAQIERAAAEANVAGLMDAAEIEMVDGIDPALLLDATLLED